MNKKEVMKAIGKDNWADFLEFMNGQTVGINKDGSFNYYEIDVERYASQRFKKWNGQ